VWCFWGFVRGHFTGQVVHLISYLVDLELVLVACSSSRMIVLLLVVVLVGVVVVASMFVRLLFLFFIGTTNTFLD
jgi:hypothetical protein